MTVLRDGSTVHAASWARRLTAKLIDLTITAAIAFAAYVMAALLYHGYSREVGFFNYHPVTDQEAYVSFTPFLGVLLFEAATVTTTAWRGTTPGKKLLGIKVVAHSDSLRPGATRAIIRWTLPLISTVPLIDAFIRDIPELSNDWQAPALAGRLWWIWITLGCWLLAHAPALWDLQRRSWIDKAADTIVINARR
ncbi:MAG: RDD family protein [Acidimicrobiaceae bacterium]|nr:RDD family protein [Acidimicrobiaceae bacterium]